MLYGGERSSSLYCAPGPRRDLCSFLPTELHLLIFWSLVSAHGDLSEPWSCDLINSLSLLHRLPMTHKEVCTFNKQNIIICS